MLRPRVNTPMLVASKVRSGSERFEAFCMGLALASAEPACAGLMRAEAKVT